MSAGSRRVRHRKDLRSHVLGALRSFLEASSKRPTACRSRCLRRGQPTCSQWLSCRDCEYDQGAGELGVERWPPATRSPSVCVDQSPLPPPEIALLRQRPRVARTMPVGRVSETHGSSPPRAARRRRARSRREKVGGRCSYLYSSGERKRTDPRSTCRAPFVSPSRGLGTAGQSLFVRRWTLSCGDSTTRAKETV